MAATLKNPSKNGFLLDPLLACIFVLLPILIKYTPLINVLNYSRLLSLSVIEVFKTAVKISP